VTRKKASQLTGRSFLRMPSAVSLVGVTRDTHPTPRLRTSFSEKLLAAGRYFSAELTSRILLRLAQSLI
jgi:hypothetical protein